MSSPGPAAGRTGQGWARVGVTAGAAVSIAANVLHSFIPPSGAPDDWHPHVGAVVGAVWWPLSLFLALEVLVSARWGSGRWWVLVRFAAVTPVVAVAAAVSYRHLSGLLVFYGEDRFTTTFGPVAVDGLMIVCSAALYRTRLAVAEAARTVRPAVHRDRPDAAPDGLYAVPDLRVQESADDGRTVSADAPDAGPDAAADASADGPPDAADAPVGDRPDAGRTPHRTARRTGRERLTGRPGGRSAEPSGRPDRTLPDWRTSDWSAVAQARGVGRTQAYTVVREEGPDAVHEARQQLAAASAALNGNGPS